MKWTLVGINIGTSKLMTVSASQGQPERIVEIPLEANEPNSWLAALDKGLRQTKIAQGNTLVAVCGTSGTFLFIDNRGAPLGPPKMYNQSQQEFVGVHNFRADSREVSKKIALAKSSGLMNVYEAWNRLSTREQTRVRWVIPQSVWLTYSLVKPPGSDWNHLSCDASNHRKLINSSLRTQQTEEILIQLGLPSGLLPVPVPSGTVVGRMRGSISVACGLLDCTIFHGVTDAYADAIMLIGDRENQIAIMAGSTSAVKGNLPISQSPMVAEQTAPNPVNKNSIIYTNWITAGENLRIRAKYEGISIESLIASAWALCPSVQIPTIPLSQTPNREDWKNIQSAQFARAIIESVVWWETDQIKRFNGLIGQSVTEVHTVGGTIRDENWIQLRANSYGVPVRIYETSTSIGVLLPGLIASGIIKSRDEFDKIFKMKTRVVTPAQLPASHVKRRHKGFVWISKLAGQSV